VLRADAKISRKELFDAENGQAQVNSRAFVASMRDKGFRECRSGSKGGAAGNGQQDAEARRQDVEGKALRHVRLSPSQVEKMPSLGFRTRFLSMGTV
jgi:hypothetical protein